MSKVFQLAKKYVSTKEAAEHYGLKPNKNNMISCIFHKDNHPSMKVDERYYCFSCQRTGDVIDFVSNLLGINSKEAAEKIVSDFGLNLTDGELINSGNDNFKNKKELSDINYQFPKARKINSEEYLKLISKLVNYRDELQNRDDEEAGQLLLITNYLLDYLENQNNRTIENEWDEINKEGENIGERVRGLTEESGKTVTRIHR